MIPLVDLKAQYDSIRDEIREAIDRVLETTAFIGGEALTNFEQAFAEFCDVPYAVGVANGTDALYLSIRALGIGSGDEVITAANSFIATSEAISLTGATPVFVDVDEKRYTLDPAKVAEAITGKTKAIVPVHLYGQPAEMDALMALAEQHDLRIVNDCAQAHGAMYKGQAIGHLGDLSCFSFFPGKNLGAYGDAGGIVTRDEAWATLLTKLRNHGRLKKYYHDVEGVNSRLDGLQAAILGVKLAHLQAWTEQRIAVAAAYTEKLKNAVVTPWVSEDVRHVFHLYVIRVEDRDNLQIHLKGNGVAAGIHYPVPLHLQPAYKHLGYAEGDFPVAERLSKEILSLPIYPELTPEQIQTVCDAVLARVG